MASNKRRLKKGDKNHDFGALYLFLKYFNEIDSFKYEPDDVNQDVIIYSKNQEWAVNIKSVVKKDSNILDATKKIDDACADIIKHKKDYNKADKTMILINKPVMIEDNIVSFGEKKDFSGNEVEIFHTKMADLVNYILTKHKVVTSQRLLLDKLFKTLLDLIVDISCSTNEVLFSKEMFNEMVKIITFNELLEMAEPTDNVEIKMEISNKISDHNFREGYYSDFMIKYEEFVAGKKNLNDLEFEIADNDEQTAYMRKLISRMKQYNEEIEGWNENQ